MRSFEILFWALFGIVFFTYVGYGVVLYFTLLLRSNKKSKKGQCPEEKLPSVSLVVACYNEYDYIKAKIENSLSLDYPKDRFEVVFVSDGTTDWSYDILMACKDVVHLYQNERKGKAAALNRAMEHVKSDIVVFSDANAMLNRDAISLLVGHFREPEVGCVSGEKRIAQNEADPASVAGEGMYWKYESSLKKMDSDLNTGVGAAGELFAIRRKLYSPIPENTILDDFQISMEIVKSGYKTVYEPRAFAVESGSKNIKEEIKRKVRIASGGIQAVARFFALFNIYKYRTLSFQYISHRVLRWTVTPISLFALLPLNFVLATYSDFYLLVLAVQLVFYAFAYVGWKYAERNLKKKAFYIPFYFLIMNYCVLLGIVRYIFRGQSVRWEKAQRA